jgi:kynureninase
MVPMKEHFSRFLEAYPDRLHVAAHSHHLWPDVSFDAQARAWLDAAELVDDKWDRILGEVVPEAQTHIARRLHLSDPATIAFAPSIHALLVRLLSSLPRPLRILTTDAEFPSFGRQARRLEEAGQATVVRVAAEPYATFPARFTAAAAEGGHHLVWLSHVHYNSGYVVPDLPALVEAVPDPATVVALDAYHGFMALPTDLAPLEHRVFYAAGGYKYAMAGEGACFLHCPPAYAERPVDTGWFAGFDAVIHSPGSASVPATAASTVAYPADGRRFQGGTFDSTGVYRFNSVQRWFDGLGLTVDGVHAHVRRLQDRFLADLPGELQEMALVPGRDEVPDRGNFLTFRSPRAFDLRQRLHAAGVITDSRGDRIRFGFGLYHDDDDIAELAHRLRSLAP